MPQFDFGGQSAAGFLCRCSLRLPILIGINNQSLDGRTNGVLRKGISVCSLCFRNIIAKTISTKINGGSAGKEEKEKHFNCN